MTRARRPTLAGAAMVLLATWPSMADPARNSVERNRAAMCAKADADGDSYRPFVCDPRCDCLSPFLTQVTGCDEVAPGDFEIVTTEPARDATCFGRCAEATAEPNVCIDHGPCRTTSDCPPPSGPGSVVCVFTDPTACGGSGENVAICLDPGLTCVVDADCAPGFECNPALGCVHPDPPQACPDTAPATTPIVCASVPASPVALASLEGVTGADGPEAVQCVSPAGTSPINSNDALECLLQLETALGQACAPFSP